MSAKKPPRLAGLGRRKKLVVVCLAIVCALIAVGLYAWQSQPVPEAGASVTTAEGKSRQEIQDELDAIVRDNMMTISVAPVAQLQEDGKLRVNVQNVQDNKFPPAIPRHPKRRDHVRIRCGRDRQDNRDMPRRRHQRRRGIHRNPGTRCQDPRQPRQSDTCQGTG